MNVNFLCDLRELIPIAEKWNFCIALLCYRLNYELTGKLIYNIYVHLRLVIRDLFDEDGCFQGYCIV